MNGNRNQGMNQKYFISTMLAAALIFVVISATNTTTTHSATAFCLGDCSLSESSSSHPTIPSSSEISDSTFRYRCETILSAMGVYDEHQINKCVETAKVIFDDLKHAYDTN